jgi:hypothetical protein
MEKNIDLIPFRANILKKHLEKKKQQLCQTPYI